MKRLPLTVLPILLLALVAAGAFWRLAVFTRKAQRRPDSPAADFGVRFRSPIKTACVAPTWISVENTCWIFRIHLLSDVVRQRLPWKPRTDKIGSRAASLCRFHLVDPHEARRTTVAASLTGRLVDAAPNTWSSAFSLGIDRNEIGQ